MRESLCYTVFMFTMKKPPKPTWNKKQADEAIQQRDAEIRALCDQYRREGRDNFYAEIGRMYGLTRERIRQIDDER